MGKSSVPQSTLNLCQHDYNTKQNSTSFATEYLGYSWRPFEKEINYLHQHRKESRGNKGKHRHFLDGEPSIKVDKLLIYDDMYSDIKFVFADKFTSIL